MKIEEKIEQFICWVEKHPNKKSQVSYLLVDFNCGSHGVPRGWFVGEGSSPESLSGFSRCNLFQCDDISLPKHFWRC